MPYFYGPNGTLQGTDAGEAFRGAYDAAQLKQKQSKLADLLANAYGSQDQAQRQGYITDAIRTDPAQGMTLAKLLDPRFSTQQDATPASIRELQMLQQNPELAKLDMQRRQAGFDRPQFHTDAQGNGWWVRPGEQPIPVDGQSQQPAEQQDSQANAGLDQPGYGGASQGAFDPQAFYADIGKTVGPLGGRITSTNGGQHSPGSNHPGGRAVDVGMGRETPEQQQAILDALNKSGYRVVDERQRPQGQSVWSGPHLHVEPGQRDASQPAPGRINFGNPAKATSALQEKIDMARKMGATPGQIRQMVVGGSSESDSAPLSDAAIDNAAARYNVTGTIPPLGMGKAAAEQRSRILTRAAELANGQSSDELAMQPANYRNSQATLKGLQQSSAAMSRATNALHSNATLLLSASKKVLGRSLTGTRIENEARLAYGRQTNDPDIAAYDQYVQTVANEYAKIMGGAPGSNAAATEGARQDAERAIHKASSPEALQATVNSLYKEAENFRNANDAEIARVRSTLVGGRQSASPQRPAASGGWKIEVVN